jgi:hypothetical protein
VGRGLTSTTEELLGRKSSHSGLENRIMAIGIHHADHMAPFYPQKLALTSPTSSGRSVGIVRSWTQATEFSLILVLVRLDSYTVFCPGYQILILTEPQ